VTGDESTPTGATAQRPRKQGSDRRGPDHPPGTGGIRQSGPSGNRGGGSWMTEPGGGWAADPRWEEGSGEMGEDEEGQGKAAGDRAGEALRLALVTGARNLVEQAAEQLKQAGETEAAGSLLSWLDGAAGRAWERADSFFAFGAPRRAAKAPPPNPEVSPPDREAASQARGRTPNRETACPPPAPGVSSSDQKQADSQEAGRLRDGSAASEGPVFEAVTGEYLLPKTARPVVNPRELVMMRLREEVLEQQKKAEDAERLTREVTTGDLFKRSPPARPPNTGRCQHGATRWNHDSTKLVCLACSAAFQIGVCIRCDALGVSPPLPAASPQGFVCERHLLAGPS
jgi:hypothetical protein